MLAVLLGTVVVPVASSCFGQRRLEDGSLCLACNASLVGRAWNHVVRGEVEDGKTVDGWHRYHPGSQALLLLQQRLCRLTI